MEQWMPPHCTVLYCAVLCCNALYCTELYYYVSLQVYFTRTRRQVTRLQAIAKSPIFSHFSETINGAATIRAFNQQVT